MKSTPFTLETLHPAARRLYEALAMLDSGAAGVKGFPLHSIMYMAGEADTQDCLYRIAQCVADDLVACDGAVYDPATLFWIVK